MWTFSNPVKVQFGVDVIDSIGDIIAGCPYCLVTYDEPFFADISQRIARLAGAPALTINNISPNPDFITLRSSCKQLQESTSQPTLIVAVGGGSVIDAAKVLSSGGNGFDPVQSFLETGNNVGELTTIPLIAVPTTAGTGSEVTSWATVWDTEGNRKHSLARPELYPSHAVVDPNLMCGMPRTLTVNTGLDALSHALESIWNKNSNPVSTNFAVNAANEILEWLPKLADDLTNITLRERIARAALFAGFAFSNTKTALAHSLSYPITLQHDIPHGLACSFSLAMVMRSVTGFSESCDEGLRRIFGQDLEAGADRLEEFLVNLGVSVNKAEYGVSDEEWRSMIDAALAGERGRNFIGSRDRVYEVFG